MSLLRRHAQHFGERAVPVRARDVVRCDAPPRRRVGGVIGVQPVGGDGDVGAAPKQRAPLRDGPTPPRNTEASCRCGRSGPRARPRRSASPRSRRRRLSRRPSEASTPGGSSGRPRRRRRRGASSRTRGSNDAFRFLVFAPPEAPRPRGRLPRRRSGRGRLARPPRRHPARRRGARPGRSGGRAPRRPPRRPRRRPATARNRAGRFRRRRARSSRTRQTRFLRARTDGGWTGPGASVRSRR